MFAIGIDIGGMSIKAGLVDENGKIILQSRIKTEGSPEQIIERMIIQIEELLSKSNMSIKQIKGIGIGCPGAVTSETGVVEFLPNLSWNKIPLSKMLKNKLDTTIRLSNDANVAALAEVIYGAAKKYNTCVMFTLGTGVGGGIVIDKKLFEGGRSFGAELGHTTLVLDGEPCNCGRSGCIESYISATALIKQTKAEMLKNKESLMWAFANGDIDKVDGRTAFECAKKGDKSAITVRDNYIRYLSESIINMLNIFRPDAFILGGGVSAQGKYLTDLVQNYCEKKNYGYLSAPRTEIITAELGNDAGIIGAAALINQ